jgi:FkbM family methyltransferase
MQKFFKQLRRKLFGLDEQEAAMIKAIADTNDLIAGLQKSFDHLHLDYSRALVEVVAQAQPQTTLSCEINGVSLRMPVEILRAYAHCLETSQEFSFTYCIESHCVHWLGQHLRPGDVFFDVGAAYGVISIPLAEIVGGTGHIYAFEPARQTRHSLEQIIKGNHLEHITVLPLAIADETGEAEFIEYSTDNRFSWAADTSTLAKDVEPSLDNYATYAVEITTIDKFAGENNLRPKAIKIDIEGFELYALQGAMETLKTCRPYLCIDIHADVKTKKSALLGVQPLLEGLGYRCESDGHTLFASPM